MKLLTTTLLAAFGLAVSADAGPATIATSNKEYKGPVEPSLCFGDREWQFDIYGAFADGNRPHAGPLQEHGWGGGVGINYFFTRSFGLGVDATWLYAHDNAGDADRNNDSDDGRDDRVARRLGVDTDHTTIHNFSGSLIWRFPIDSMCVAPYLYAGGGCHVDGEQWASAHAGVGVEYRIVPQRVGIFTDARFTYFGDRFGNGDQNNIMARAGIRFVF